MNTIISLVNSWATKYFILLCRKGNTRCKKGNTRFSYHIAKRQWCATHSTWCQHKVCARYAGLKRPHTSSLDILLWHFIFISFIYLGIHPGICLFVCFLYSCLLNDVHAIRKISLFVDSYYMRLKTEFNTSPPTSDFVSYCMNKQWITNNIIKHPVLNARTENNLACRK